MTTTPKVDRWVIWSLGATSLAISAAVAVFNPRVVSFRPFDATDFLQMMLPLVMVSLFIERALEVFLTSWRAKRGGQLKERAKEARTKRQIGGPRHADEIALDCHQNQTRRVAFFAGTALGVILAALGIRVLEMFVNPSAFASLPDVQQSLFRTTDVLLTGAVLGGGSDALHQMVLVFTNFFESAKGRTKGPSGNTVSTESGGESPRW